MSGNCEENSKTIWSPSARLLCAAEGHACFSMANRRRLYMLHCRLSLQRRGLICPQFSCFTLKITTPSILKEEKDLFSLGETGPKKKKESRPARKAAPRYPGTARRSSATVHQICLSHINFAKNREKHAMRACEGGSLCQKGERRSRG